MRGGMQGSKKVPMVGPIWQWTPPMGGFRSGENEILVCALFEKSRFENRSIAMQSKNQKNGFFRKNAKNAYLATFYSKMSLQRPLPKFNFPQKTPFRCTNSNFFYLIRMRSEIMDLNFCMQQNVPKGFQIKILSYLWMYSEWFWL